MKERWRRLWNWPWYLWVPLIVAIVAAALAMWLALWAAYDIVPGLAFDWLGSPRLSTAQIVPFLIGALGVTATVSAILAGVGELRVVFPPQHLSFGLNLWRPEGRGPVLDLWGWNDGAFVSAFSFGYVWRDSKGAVFISNSKAGGGESLVPGQQFKADLIQVSGHEDALGGTLTVSWATDRSKNIRYTPLPVPTEQELPVVPT